MPPELIVFAGPACAGKSTLAAALSRETAFPHLQMDETRRILLPGAAHTRQDRQVAYRAMAWAAELLLRASRSVILDAPYGHAEDCAAVEAVAARGAAALRWIECRVDAAEAARRFALRGPDPVRLDLTRERVEMLARSYIYRGTGLLIDTGKLNFLECMQTIRCFLNLPPPA